MIDQVTAWSAAYMESYCKIRIQEMTESFKISPVSVYDMTFRNPNKILWQGPFDDPQNSNL